MKTLDVSKNNKLTVSNIILFFMLSLWLVIILYPFYNSVLISIISQKTYISSPFMIFPKEITMEAYRYVFASKALLSGFKITGIVVLLGAAYCMLITTALAYGLTKPFPGRKLIIRLIVFTMYFGGGLIPYYIIISKLGLVDKIAVMILPMAVNTFYLIVIMNYFYSLPVSLEESAKIEGANELTIFFKIILPLSMPILATFALFYAVDRWNDWFTGLLFIKTAEKRPLQLVLRTIVSNIDSIKTQTMVNSGLFNHVFTDGVKMASVIITMLPVMIIYPFLQKYFIKGIMIGAIKS